MADWIAIDRGKSPSKRQLLPPSDRFEPPTRWTHWINAEDPGSSPPAVPGSRRCRIAVATFFSIACFHSQVALVSLPPAPGLPVVHQVVRGSLEDRDGEGPTLLYFQESN